MSTIQIKDSYKRVNQFLKKGGTLLDNANDSKIAILYKDYLISIGNKESTLLLKFRYIYLLEQYLTSINKTFKTFTKENIYDYFNECSKLKWGLSTKDRNKFDITVISMFGGGVNEKFLKNDIHYKSVFKKTFRGNSKIMKLFYKE